MSDNVNKPAHYQGDNGVEAIDIIESASENFGLSFRECNALKYILRHRQKGGAESLRKAIWYLEREIQKNYE